MRPIHLVQSGQVYLSYDAASSKSAEEPIMNGMLCKTGQNSVRVEPGGAVKLAEVSPLIARNGL